MKKEVDRQRVRRALETLIIRSRAEHAHVKALTELTADEIDVYTRLASEIELDSRSVALSNNKEDRGRDGRREESGETGGGDLRRERGDDLLHIRQEEPSEDLPIPVSLIKQLIEILIDTVRSVSPNRAHMNLVKERLRVEVPDISDQSINRLVLIAATQAPIKRYGNSWLLWT